MQKLIVMADYECGIFFQDGGSSPEELGAPAGLCRRFDDWLARYCEHNDAPVGFDRETYNAEGRSLAGEIKRLVGNRFMVIYRYLAPAAQSDADCEWLEAEIEA